MCDNNTWIHTVLRLTVMMFSSYVLSTSQNELLHFPKETCFMSSYFQKSCFSFLEWTPIWLTAFYYSKIHPNCLSSFIDFSNLHRKNYSSLVISLNLIHDSNNYFYSMETIFRLLHVFWNVSSLRWSPVIYLFVFQASHTLPDGEHIKKIISLLSFLAWHWLFHLWAVWHRTSYLTL